MQKMCAAACTVSPAGTQSRAVPGGGVKGGRSPAQLIGSRGDSLGSEGGNPRVRPRDAVLQAGECTPTKRIGGLSGDGKCYMYMYIQSNSACKFICVRASESVSE